MTYPRTTQLADLTTLGVGGPAPELSTASSAREVAELVRGRDVLVLGGGSNLVVADAGVLVPVVRIAIGGLTIQPGHELVDFDTDQALVTIGAGAVWDDVVAELVEVGWCGVETLSGIPGLAGATPIQNVGAYGTEISDVLVDVTVVDRVSGAVRTVPAADLALAYRTSRLRVRNPIRDGKSVVTQIRLRLSRTAVPLTYPELARCLEVAVGQCAPAAHVREAVVALRRRKGMVYDAADPDARSAGSFFTNPILGPAAVTAALRRICAVAGTDAHIPQYPAVQDGQPATKLSAAWLIERAGFPRGYPLVARARGSERADARIAISSRHTLAITNRGGGSAAEVVALAAEIRDGVADAFGVRLEPEPILIGLRI